ncbi:tRNA epoxyqueuosine(34) reductase QueG [Candidatus Gracilibacteria bacterium]|nr:tRNA epoxyqueuosine(34) reductase QueG [Candidatus Gracilibacteria bacterium]
MQLSEEIITFARSLGFDLIGFSPAKIEQKYLQAFDDWLAAGHQGQMQYMEKVQQRRDLTQILPKAKSVICLATNYYYDQKPLQKAHGRVARYAFGRDYHKIIAKKLKQLVAHLEQIAPEHQHKAYVDTGPILERALAEQAGLGAVGKNACLISPTHGSWLFLSEIITTLNLPQTHQPQTRWQPQPDSHFKPCANCTKCLDACPTGAIIAPGVIDSRLCISYLTIENKDAIPPALAKIIKQQKLLYGCDICQEVCPHNQARQKPHNHTEFHQKIAGDQLSTKKILALTPQKHLQTFAGSPLMRAKLSGLQRSAKVLE